MAQIWWNVDFGRKRSSNLVSNINPNRVPYVAVATLKSPYGQNSGAISVHNKQVL